MTNRTFYRTLIHVEVLSENPVAFEHLSQVAEAIYDGDCSGKWEHDDEIVNQEVDGKIMAKLLLNQGSDPAFFQIDENGDDIEDD